MPDVRRIPQNAGNSLAGRTRRLEPSTLRHTIRNNKNKLITYTSCRWVVYLDAVGTGSRTSRTASSAMPKRCSNTHATRPHPPWHWPRPQRQARGASATWSLADPDQAQTLLYAHLIDGPARNPWINTAAVEYGSAQAQNDASRRTGRPPPLSPEDSQTTPQRVGT